ncbi:hypothetical protein BGZ70_002698 [Mortierella alpina]|uniref:Thioesterase domain-containing protein n=1 Tax=Mortierella alpina TaxID=64518 RepID=A0A9P6ITK5_MORAP|nr:hypothetical protein BGZ70_002698 [Mortierella alpina]
MPISSLTAEDNAPVKTLVEAISRDTTTTTTATDSTVTASATEGAVTRPTTPVPSAKEQDLQQQLETLDIVRAHVQDAQTWKRRQAYSLVTDDYRVHHLTAGTLRGDDKLGVAPALFQSLDESRVLSVLHVGRGLCGHPNIVHGGLLATMLDEITAMTAIPNLPGKTGFTANLNINYRHPCIADQFIVAHSEVTSLEGRKAFVKATLTTLDGTLLADATALFIAPRIPVAQIAEQLSQAKQTTNSNKSATPAPAPASAASVSEVQA